MESKLNKNTTCIIKNCQLDIYNDVRCILHSDKKDKDVDKFWEQIQDDLYSKYKCKQGQEEIDSFDIQYNSVVFPKFQKDYLYDPHDSTLEVSNFYFKHYKILEDGCCSKDEESESYTNKLIEECNIRFNNCTFLDKVNLERYNFKESIIFHNCIFEKKICLKDIFNAYVEFRDCDFKNNELNLYDKNFNETFILVDCKNIKKINVTNSVFEKGTSFLKSSFMDTVFFNTRFKDIAVFVESTFEKSVDFKYTFFEKNVFFKNAIFEKKLNLENSIIKEEANFLHIKQKNGKELKLENISNRETARIIKNSFEKQNNIIEANKYYALEMEKKTEELKNEKNTIEKFIFNIHGLSSNHSQDPLRAFFWIIILGIISATIDFFSMIHFGRYIHGQPYMIVGLIVFVPLLFCIINIIKDKNFVLSFLILFLMLSSYCLITKDFYTFCSLFTKTINPFSMMFSNDSINLIQLIFKAIFAYLYYQLIVSIRQNTRRK